MLKVAVTRRRVPAQSCNRGGEEEREGRRRLREVGDAACEFPENDK